LVEVAAIVVAIEGSAEVLSKTAAIPKRYKLRMIFSLLTEDRLCYPSIAARVILADS